MPKGEETNEETAKAEETSTEPQIPDEIKAELEKLKGEVGQLNIGLARKEGLIRRLKEQQTQPSGYPATDSLEQLAEEVGRLGGEYGDAGSAARIQALTQAIRQEKDNIAREQSPENIILGRRRTS